MSIQNFIRVSQVILLSLLIFVGCKDNPVSDGGFSVEAGSILFISDKSGSYQLYSMNEDGSNVQQLTNDPNFPILDASWSPDGKKIAVVSLVGDESTYPFYRYAIFIMDAYGRNRYQLTQQYVYVDDPVYGKLTYAGALHPVWSTDGKQIAYSRLMVPEAIANRDIFTINIDGTNEKRVTTTISVNETITDWSPDGQSFLCDIINWSKPGSRKFVAILSTRGEMKKQISVDTVTSGHGLWSPNQAYIVLTSWSGVRHDLFISDGDGNNARVLRTTNNTFNYPVAWSSDNQRILFNSSGDIFMVRRDGGGLTKITPVNFAEVEAVSWRRR
ncbi:TolB family protein [Rosettibacter firmus]|uniref:TolB family protein n=1 Tax=Rosettibacter firmus TaxID=3111522 RepID=UPI00336C1E79